MSRHRSGAEQFENWRNDTVVIAPVRPRRRWWPPLLAAGAVAVLVLGAVVVGDRLTRSPALGGPAGQAVAVAATSGAPAHSSYPKPSTTPAAKPSPKATPKASPSPSHSPTAKASPRPAPTRKKGAPPAPPKPKRSPVAGCSKPFYVGTNATTSDVKAALHSAATTKVWTVSDVNLPPALIDAVAWQESGWQSAIRACDGGIGTMQVMPNTATMMNNRFDANWDVKTLAGNTMVGSAYLQWLIKYFGDAYFGARYTIDEADCASSDPAVPDYETPCLLNAVIAAYNFGAGAVGKDTIVIPNPGYVSDVRALMDSCPCSAN